MKHSILSGIAAIVMGLTGSVAGAASFTGYSETGPDLFNDNATLDFDPLGLGGTIFDAFNSVDISFNEDISTGTLLVTDAFTTATIAEGTSLLGYMLSVDNDINDDSLSLLFGLSTGSTPFAIATFTGDLDGFGVVDFLTEGALFVEGGLRIVGAQLDPTGVIPVPATLPLILAGLGGLVVVARRRKES